MSGRNGKKASGSWMKPLSFIYELPADDRELHRLVAQDPQLRPFIIKAEKFHVLVAESDASRFTERMKELGYLIG